MAQGPKRKGAKSGRNGSQNADTQIDTLQQRTKTLMIENDKDADTRSVRHCPDSDKHLSESSLESSIDASSRDGGSLDPIMSENKESCWKLAAERLENKDPKTYEALHELRGNQSFRSEAVPSEMVEIIQKQKKRMEQRQWVLPFRVRGREIKIRDQLDTVLKGLQMFKDFGSVLSNLDPVHIGIPWVGVNIILQGALNDSEQYRAALSGLAQISPIAARYTEVEVMYIQEKNTRLEKEFENHVVDLYVEILKYQVAAACHCKSSTFHRFLRALPKLDDWKGMIESIKEKDSICREMTRVFDSQDQRLVNFKLQSLAEKNDEMMKTFLQTLKGISEEQKKENARIPGWICRHVAGRDHQSILVQGKMGTEYADSGQWLINDPKFKGWASTESKHSSSFWVCGPVGCGKSSLVSRVIEWHLEGLASNPLTQVAYFYCSRTQGKAQDPGTTPETVMGSIVSQLLWCPNGSGIAKRVSDLYTSWKYERPDEARLSLEESANIAGDLINSWSQTTIIIDALDECSQPYPLLRTLKRVVKESAGRVKLFLSSRMNVDVSSVLVDISRVDVQVGDTSADVFKYISKELKESDRRLLKGKEPELEDRVITTLNSRAQGMFRWVELQLAIFLDENSPFRLPEDVEARLDQLNAKSGLPDLASVYKEIYEKNTREASRDREYSIKAYKLVLCSRRPLYAHEFTEAVSLGPDGSLNKYVDRQYVLQICSNFLVIDHWTEVRFAHLSVVEFLKGGTFGNMFSDSLAHAQAAETCLSCLQPNARSEADRVYGKRFNAYFFSSYAGIYWPAHYQSTSEDERQHGALGELYNEFISDSKSKPTFVAWMDICCSNTQVYQKHAYIQIMASTSLGPFFSKFAKLLHNAYQSGEDRIPENETTALHHGVQWNCMPIVSLLVESGADVNVPSKTGEMPFHRAVRLGYHGIATFLAQHGGDAHDVNLIELTSSESREGPFPSTMRTLLDRLRPAKASG